MLNAAKKTNSINTLKCNQHYAINDNNYFIDVTNIGLHNKDFALVTQAF